MSKDLTKRAAEMLLKGATLLSEPCPYCKGVRVIKNGKALCVSCGKRPEERIVPIQKSSNKAATPIEKILEKKMEVLSQELEHEKDHQKQQNILKTINSLLETMEKIKEKQ